MIIKRFLGDKVEIIENDIHKLVSCKKKFIQNLVIVAYIKMKDERIVAVISTTMVVWW